MFYRKWKIKNFVVLDVRSATHLEALLIKQGMLFLAHLYCFRRVQRWARAIAHLICRSLKYGKTREYYWLKTLLHITLLSLNPLTKNECTVKDSFQYAEEILEQNLWLSMGGLDVDTLFTNIPVGKLLIFASISSFKTLRLLKFLQSPNSKNNYVWSQRSCFLYLSNKLQTNWWCSSGLTSWTLPY